MSETKKVLIHDRLVELKPLNELQLGLILRLGKNIGRLSTQTGLTQEDGQKLAEALAKVMLILQNSIVSGEDQDYVDHLIATGELYDVKILMAALLQDEVSSVEETSTEPLKPVVRRGRPRKNATN